MSREAFREPDKLTVMSPDHNMQSRKIEHKTPLHQSDDIFGAGGIAAKHNTKAMSICFRQWQTVLLEEGYLKHG